MENKSCCFSGHRIIAKKDYEKIFNLTDNKIVFLIKSSNFFM